MRAGLFLVLLWSIGHAQPAADSSAILKQARADISILCSDSLFGRGYRNDGHVRAARYIRARLASLHPDTLVEQSFVANGVMSARPDAAHPRGLAIPVEQVPTQNVIALWRGSVADTAIVLCAHFDHLGVDTSTGEIFRGANDNAAGVALLLHLAEAFSRHRLRYSVLVLATSGEEAGLLGSTFFASNPILFPLERIKEVWNLDLVGFGDRGIVVVGGALADRTPTEMGSRIRAANARLTAFASVQLRPNRPNSDQWPFHARGIPAVFLFTEGGPGHYHDTHDVPDSLTLSHFVSLGRLIQHCILRR
jgi:hypothetical protein